MERNKKTGSNPKAHIQRLIEWMSQGVYEKDQIIAMALLCAVAGENMFLLGPPGTAKSMVASRLKMVFKDGKSFDYLMSRFSTPDEIFGPISISRLKNDDRYERLTAGYLPEADVAFLDEIWKAGPSIQNTLLTVINEHIFHNGGQIMRTPMKVLIAASNELPAQYEGLEALWDRFLVRMVSNCIESDDSFFKMIQEAGAEMTRLPDELYITEKAYAAWQSESRAVGIKASVVNAIKALRKNLAALEQEDGKKLRYYVSDRRWRKAYRLMQTSAYLNGRKEINLSDFLLLIHSFWNDDECIPNILTAVTSSMSDKIIRDLNEIDRIVRGIMTEREKQSRPGAVRAADDNDGFEEYDYFYYLVENYPGGDTFFSKWDYSSLSDSPRDGVLFYDSKRKRNIIHAIIPGKQLAPTSQDSGSSINVTLQRNPDGVTIDGMPYAFRRKGGQKPASSASLEDLPLNQRILEARNLFDACVSEWERLMAECLDGSDNIFLSADDLALAEKMIKEVRMSIKKTEIRLNNTL